jgi:GMC oxidoreductase
VSSPIRRGLILAGVTGISMLACFAVAIGESRSGGGPPSTPDRDSTSLHAIHDAVFDTWFPLDSLPLRDDVRAQARVLRDRLWPSFSGSQTVTRQLGALREWARSQGAGTGDSGVAFEHRSLASREKLWAALLRSPENENRRVGMQLRLAYLSAIYASPLGRQLAGLDPASETESSNRAPSAKPLSFPPTWLVYDPARRTLEARVGRIDDVIVGSGPAGAVLAHELQRAGQHVVLLEQGSFVVPGSMDTRALPNLLESGGRRSSVSGSVLFNNAETVGGGSVVNIDLVFSPDHASIRHQIDAWRRGGWIGHTQYGDEALKSADAWVRSQLGTRTPTDAEINRNNRALWDGAARAGLNPRLYDLNTYAPGAWPTPQSDKRTAVAALLLPAMNAPSSPLALVPDARVTRVRIERTPAGRVARGVDFIARAPWKSAGVMPDPLGLSIRGGDTVHVDADRVILCAGTLGSATILLRSGLDDPDIGRGVIAHPAVPVIGRFDERIDAFRGTPATVHVDDFALTHGFMLEAMSAGPQYAAIMIPGTGRQIFEGVRHYGNLAGFGAMLIDEPSRENRVVVNGDGSADIRYELSARDRVRLAFAVEEAARIMFLAGAREVYVPSYELRGDGSDVPGEGFVLTDSSQVRGIRERLKFVPNCSIVTSAHLQASNKMGTKPNGSVVRPDHQVWGVSALYVCDSSTFPSSIGANPMQSIYVFSKLFADDLLRKVNAREGAPGHKQP